MSQQAIKPEEDILTLASNAMSEYATYVILNRAIPDVRDGLKPVHRRILYGLQQLGLYANKPHKKSARVVGEIVGKYHPHGTQSVYDAMVTLAQPFGMRVPLIDGQGNFGSISGDGAAAMRYTECRMSESSALLLENLNKNAVDMLPNFDGEEVEPRVLPAAFPVAAINGTLGIGYGYASTIAPHNPLEVLDAAIYLAATKHPKIEKLQTIIQGPDFPNGGEVVIDSENLVNDLTTGQSKFIYQADVKYHEGKEPFVEICSVPYQVSSNKLIEKIAEVLEKAKAFNVTDIHDESQSDLDISIKIRFRKGTKLDVMQKAVALLYQRTPLRTSISPNNLVICKGKPVNLGLIQYLKEFNQFRLETLKRVWTFDYQKLKDRLHILEGLIKMINIIDEVIEFSRHKADSKQMIIDWLMNDHHFSEKQANAIVAIQIYQLNKANVDAYINESNDVMAKMEELYDKIYNEESATKALIADLKQTKKVFANQTRRTKIISPEVLDAKVEEVSVVDTIAEKDLKVVVKKGLKAFSIGARAYENQIDSYKDDDIVTILDAKTTQYVFLVTKSGGAVVRLVNDLENLPLIGQPDAFNTQIKDLQSSDEFVGAFVTDDAQRFVMLSAYGFAKVINPSKALPNVNTKSYQKRLHSMSSLKVEGDSILTGQMIPVNELANYELHYELYDPSKDKAKAKVIDCAAIAKRNDGAGGSGTRLMNTKDGQLIIQNVEFKLKSSEI